MKYLKNQRGINKYRSQLRTVAVSTLIHEVMEFVVVLKCFPKYSLTHKQKPMMKSHSVDGGPAFKLIQISMKSGERHTRGKKDGWWRTYSPLRPPLEGCFVDDVTIIIQILWSSFPEYFFFRAC